MMGRQVGEAQLFYIFSVDRHVPADHLLRRVDAVLDLSFIRTSLAEHYSRTGRPSIDPELMIRMLLVGYLYGIRSETRLCEEVHLNLAYRWFCRLGLDGDVPERSTFSKNRHGRFREGDLFRRLFEEVVRRCVAAGLVGGTGAAVDGSVVEADASRERRLPGDRLPEAWSNRESQAQPVRAYLDALDAASAPARDEPKQAAPKHLSETDPQAAWSIKTGPGRFRYETNYLVDTAHAVILDVEATPARLSQEIVAAKRMLQRTRDRLGLTPRRLAADGSYGTGPFLSWLVRAGCRAACAGARAQASDQRQADPRRLRLRSQAQPVHLPNRTRAHLPRRPLCRARPHVPIERRRLRGLPGSARLHQRTRPHHRAPVR